MFRPVRSPEGWIRPLEEGVRNVRPTAKTAIQNTVRASGLWDGERADTHRFLMTPDLFPLSTEQTHDLRRLGAALVECMEGASRIAAIAKSGELGRGLAWRELQELSVMQVEKAYRLLQVARPKQIPRVIKADFVEGVDGHLWLAEIDAMNRRGMGYATLLADIRKVLKPAASAFPGVPSLLAREVKRRQSDRMVFLYGHKERWYLPEFEILQTAMRREGIEVIVADELDMKVEHGRIFVRGVEEPSRLFVNFPVIAKNPDLLAGLSAMYLAGDLQCLIPPKPFLGSKALGGILRNDDGDETLEAILRSQIDGVALEIVRRHTPETFFVRRQGKLPAIGGDHAWVLKEAIASGAKGVVFSTDPGFPQAVAAARKTNGRYVLQREVTGRQREFGYYDHDAYEIQRASWYTRLIVYFIASEPANVSVTGCRTKLVHGGKDAILMDSVFDE